MLKVIITKDYKELSAKAADFVLAQVWEKPKSVLGLATGSTPVGLYQELISAYKEGRADFSKITSFNLDEYVGLGPADRQSYHYFMKHKLFKKINIRVENIFIPNGLVNQHEVWLKSVQYERAIKRHGGIDLQILGIGHNGHVGFNEPGSSFRSRTRLVKLSKSTIAANARFFRKDKTKMPTKAITMGLKSIIEAKKIILLANGKDKAEIIAKAIEGPVSPKVPASILQKHPDVTVIIDEAAASKLKKDYSSPLLLTNRNFTVLTQKDLPQNKKVIVISPHPDDASISLGGTIFGLSKNNKVYTLIMTTGYRSFIANQDREQRISTREQEVKTEGEILGAKPIFLRLKFYDAKNERQAIEQDVKTVTKNLREIKPDIIFLPHQKDSHPTHLKSRMIALRALHKTKIKPELWLYEGPWSVFAEGDFNTIFAFSKIVMRKKMKAIREQKSQVSRTRFDIAAESLSKLRAALIPEQALSGFGQQGPKLGDYYELFQVVKK